MPQICDELRADGDEDDPKTLLMAACKRELPSLLIIKLLGIPYRVENATPLHSLACGRHWWQIEALEYLLERGANIEATNSQGQTPLLVTVSNGDRDESWTEETVEVFLRHGANPNVCGKEETPDTCPVAKYTDGTTVLQGILQDRGVVDPILEIPGLDIEHRGKKNRTLLITASVPTVVPHWNPWRPPSPPVAITQSGHIMKLLELGAAVDAVDDDGRTALHLSCITPGDISDECEAAFDASRSPGASNGGGSAPRRPWC